MKYETVLIKLTSNTLLLTKRNTYIRLYINLLNNVIETVDQL